MFLVRAAAIFLLAGSPATLAAEGEASVDVTVTQLVHGVGTIYVQLCTEAEFATFKCAVRGKSKVEADTMTVTLGPVPAGRYAVSAWYDSDDSGKLETGSYGEPAEPTGASNGAKGEYGPPQFKDAAVDLNPGANALTVAVAH